MSTTDETGPLLRVCRLLNEAGANYLVAGAYAMILNSVIRATEDVGILIEDSLDNFQRVINCPCRAKIKCALITWTNRQNSCGLFLFSGQVDLY